MAAHDLCRAQQQYPSIIFKRNCNIIGDHIRGEYQTIQGRSYHDQRDERNEYTKRTDLTKDPSETMANLRTTQSVIRTTPVTTEGQCKERHEKSGKDPANNYFVIFLREIKKETKMDCAPEDTGAAKSHEDGIFREKHSKKAQRFDQTGLSTE